MKTCKKCNQNKPALSFNSGKRYADKLQPWCKECMSEYRKQWYKKNKKRVNIKSIQWRKDNPEKAKQIDKKWKSNNKAKIAERYKKYRLANKEYDCYRVSMRRAAKIQATPIWVNKQKVKEVYRLAVVLEIRNGEPYHVDHIVPLNGPNVCGLHCEDNLQAIPARRNLSMGNRLWPDMWTINDIQPKRIDQTQRQGRLL